MPENETSEPVAVSGVNRRTMILFSKKAKQRRLSAIQLMAAKDFEKKETVKIDSTRTDVSELSRRSSTNGFTVKLPLPAQSSAVDSSPFSGVKRPPAKRHHASSVDHTEPVVCNGTVSVRSTGLAEVTSRGKLGIIDDVRRKNSQRKIRVLDNSLEMFNGVSDSSDLSDSCSSRYPIRGLYCQLYGELLYLATDITVVYIMMMMTKLRAQQSQSLYHATSLQELMMNNQEYLTVMLKNVIWMSLYMAEYAETNSLNCYLRKWTV